MLAGGERGDQSFEVLRYGGITMTMGFLYTKWRIPNSYKLKLFTYFFILFFIKFQPD